MQYYKHPKIFHLPHSPGLTSDDKKLDSVEQFEGMDVVITDKKDGEQASLYKNYSHARSLDSKGGFDRDWLKAFHRKWAYMLDDHERICGENVFAEHSIPYTDLDTYFFGFGYWRDTFCYDWQTTLNKFAELGITPVPTIIVGRFESDAVQKCMKNLEAKIAAQPKKGANLLEGYVLRNVNGFEYEDYSKNAAKYVRPEHVQTDKFWRGHIVANKLKE